MNYSQLVIETAKRRGNPAAALRQMWKEPYFSVTPQRRHTVLTVGKRYKGVMVEYHANGYLVDVDGVRVAFNLDTQPTAMARIFGLQEYVNTIAAMMDFSGVEPSPALVPVEVDENE